MNKFKTTFLVAVIFFTIGFVTVPQKASAQECIDFLASMHEASLLNFDPAMDRTVDAFFDSGGVATFTKLAGYDPNTYIGCVSWANSHIGEAGGCSETPESLCNQLGGLYYTDFENPATRRDNRMAGSLLGLSYALEEYSYTQPVPVSLALFMDDTVDRLPFVQRSLAQTDYGHTLVNAVLDVWKVSRNIALALMSIVLLVMGFLIITRKRISQQVVVNVQYALPKVVVSLILIIFSYPIGATMASLFWSMFHNIPEIITSLYGTVSPVVSVGESLAGGVGVFLVLLLAYMASAAMTAGLSLFLLVAVLGLLLGMVVYYYIKVLTIYIKMVFSIISAPVEFVIGSIPGSDDKIMAWFKRMVTYGLSLALMGGVITFVRILGGLIITEYQTYATGLGDLVGFLSVPLLWIFGYGMAISMPRKVEDFMSGGRKPGRK